jgi:hypothetical protein
MIGAGFRFPSPPETRARGAGLNIGFERVHNSTFPPTGRRGQRQVFDLDAAIADGAGVRLQTDLARLALEGRHESAGVVRVEAQVDGLLPGKRSRARIAADGHFERVPGASR